MERNSLSNFDKGWISALLDGEGSIRLRERSDSETYKPSIAVSNNSRKILETLKEKVPQAKIYSESRENENWQDTYQLVIWKHDTICWLLQEIKEHLVIKEKKAELMIKFLNLREESTRERDESGKFVASKTDPKEEELFRKFKHL